MEMLAVYDTKEIIESKFTPDLLAQIMFEHIPKSNSWASVPEEDDPTGKNYKPQWSDIAEASAEVDRFLSSENAQQMSVDGFTAEELIDELRLFREELRAASMHASRFYLTIY